jgi:hypothetical protein
MSTARISRWARRFLLAGACWLVLSQVAAATGAPRGAVVVLGLYGFVLTTLFGKAYSLVPSYFDRTLAWPQAPAVQLPLLVAGVAGLTLARLGIAPGPLADVGALAWTLGVAVFLGTLAATLRGNLSGAATGTGDAKADRRRTDRVANVFVPVAFIYLAIGTTELAAGALGLPTLLGGVSVRVAHLLGPGFAVLMLFAVGFRLLPRFLAVAAPHRLAWVVLPAGAVGPALLAVGYPAGTVFVLGALAESVAVVAFAAGYAVMYRRTDRDRVGLYGPLAGVAFGCLGVVLGLYFAVGTLDIALARAHLRANVFGLLGLSIVGVAYQFYPPAVAVWPGADDRMALCSLLGLTLGLLVAVGGAPVDPTLARAGHLFTSLSAGAYLYVLAGTIRYQTL